MKQYRDLVGGLPAPAGRPSRAPAFSATPHTPYLHKFAPVEITSHYPQHRGRGRAGPRRRPARADAWLILTMSERFPRAAMQRRPGSTSRSAARRGQARARARARLGRTDRRGLARYLPLPNSLAMGSKNSSTTRSFSGIIALSVILISSGHTLVQHLVMLQ